MANFRPFEDAFEHTLDCFVAVDQPEYARGLSGWYHGTLLAGLVAWTEAAVRSVQAEIDLSPDATAEVSLRARVRVHGGWLEGLEIAGLDPEQLVAQILGLTYRVDAKLRATLVEKLGVLLPDRCGVARWELPVPSTFVVDRDATVRAAWTSPDPSVRPSVDDILAALTG